VSFVLAAIVGKSDTDDCFLGGGFEPLGFTGTGFGELDVETIAIGVVDSDEFDDIDSAAEAAAGLGGTSDDLRGGGGLERIGDGGTTAGCCCDDETASVNDVDVSFSVEGFGGGGGGVVRVTAAFGGGGGGVARVTLVGPLNVKFASASSSEIKGEGEGFEAVIF